jgi:murein DD-endopeptidase MepM/ murein hydrolase activator NlpD
MIRPIVAGRPCKNKYRLPFAGTWVTTSGPEGSHGTRAGMLNAWDFRKVDEQGRIGSGPEDKPESYYTYEAPVYACADGEVYEVIDGFADNAVGEIAPIEEGNRILIKHANGERSVVGHLKKGTAKVKVGQKVKQGELLGVLGNSGKSATPHLHFAVFDEDGISLPITFWDFETVEGKERKHVDKGVMELGKVYEQKVESRK